MTIKEKNGCLYQVTFYLLPSKFFQVYKKKNLNNKWAF